MTAMVEAMAAAVVDAAYSTRPEFAPLAHADWHGLKHGPSVIYLLAHARREAFYIDVADNLKALVEVSDQIMRRQQATLPESCWMPPLLVWFEIAADPTSAQARLQHIRSLPHAWKRGLVDVMNPAWVDLYGYFSGLPLQVMPVVGERQTMNLNLER